MRSILWATFGLVCLSTAGSAQAAAPPVELRDDRGESITSPLSLCFRTDLRSDCVDLPAGEPFVPPAPLRSLRVEGPDHGPASWQGDDLKPGADGRLRIRIPRKALLQIDKRPAEPLDVAVYDKGAPAFDKPLASVRGVGPAGCKIPAGELLVALSSGRKAPDLHRLAVRPGAVAHLEYQPRDGWSLVLRSRGKKTGKPVAAAVVSLESAPGYGAPNRPAAEAATGADGLALFSGLAGRRIDAGVRHAEFLPQTIPGLAAAPGALAFHDVALEEGGWLRARVLVKGRVRQGALCKLKDIRPPAASTEDWEPKVLYEGRTDREGICRTGRFPADSYLFEVALAESGATLERPVVLADGEETAQDLSLSEIRVRGTVTRGGEPAPGLTVVAAELLEGFGPAMLARATSGKDGTYELTLSKPGRLKFLLQASTEKPALVERDVEVAEEEEKAVDFSLERAAVRGKVVDQEGRPVAEAWVTLSWHAAAHGSYQPTDERGEFEFLLESPGDGRIEAAKRGYRKKESQDVALEEGSEPPPVVLVLTKEKAFRGTLLSAAGSPVAGGWVASTRTHYGDEGADFNEGTMEGDGRFEVAATEGVRNRLFASGPGCPLAFFDPVDAEGELALRCPARPAVLDVTLTDAAGRPVPDAALILRQGSVLFPANLLFHHLSTLGLRARTDASGRLVLPNLAPGDYDLFLESAVEVGMIEAGSHTGFLTSAHLAPLATTELRLTVPGRPAAAPGGER